MIKFIEKPVYTQIPTKITIEMFDEFFLPSLSMPKRGPKCKIGYFKLFNYILKILYTGMQWKELSIDNELGWVVVTGQKFPLRPLEFTN